MEVLKEFLEFHRVTVCPPWDPLTSLTLDLLTAEQQYLDDKSRSQVLVKVPEAVHDSGSMVMNLSKKRGVKMINDNYKYVKHPQ